MWIVFIAAGATSSSAKLTPFLEAAQALGNGVKKHLELAPKPLEYLECISVGILQLLTRRLRGFAQVGRGCGVGVGDSLTCTRFGIDQHLLTSLLRFANNRALLNEPCPFCLRVLKRPFPGCMCVVNYLVACFDNLLSLADISWDGEPHLIDEVEHALAVNDEVAANGQPPRLYEELFKAIDEVENFQ